MLIFAVRHRVRWHITNCRGNSVSTRARQAGVLLTEANSLGGSETESRASGSVVEIEFILAWANRLNFWVFTTELIYPASERIRRGAFGSFFRNGIVCARAWHFQITLDFRQFIAHVESRFGRIKVH